MAPRYAARVDDNQPEIVKMVEQLGGLVVYTHMLGQGVPDIFVAFGGQWRAVEIKDGSKPPSARKLTKAERDFHERYGRLAPVLVWESCEDVTRELLGGGKE